MKNQNRIYKLLLGVALIAELCFFLPDIQAQEFNYKTTLGNYMNNEDTTAERTYQDSTGFYIINFVYNTSYCTIPATNPPGQPHYGATITVYEIVDGKKQRIGEPFGGTYTEKGCFEDAPDYLVKTAKEKSTRQKISITGSW
jgi:hypothetical protein